MASCERSGPPPTPAACHAFFTELLLKHSVERPPFSVGIFAHTDVAAITKFAVDGYLRHVRLYQRVFCTSILLDLKVVNSFASQGITEVPALDDVLELPTSEAAAEGEGGDAQATSRSLEAAAEGATVPSLVQPVDKKAFSNPAEQDVFERAVEAELSKLNSELVSRLKEQQDAMARRLAALEQGRGGTPRK
jgi:hypothetical protein